MVQHQDNAKESRLEEWLLVELKKRCVGVKRRAVLVKEHFNRGSNTYKEKSKKVLLGQKKKYPEKGDNLKYHQHKGGS